MARRRDHNPTLAQAFEELRSDYNAAKQTRYRRRRSGVSGVGTSGDYHYRSEADYLRMMELSRDFFRNDMVVGQGVRRLVSNVIREGFTLDPQTGSDEANQILRSRWTDWAGEPDACDKAGEDNFHGMEKKILQQTVVDGDIFCLLNRSGHLQLVEAHRCRTPTNTIRNVVHGVMLDGYRKRLEYWFTRDEINPMRTVRRVGDMERYAARDAEGHRQVLHAYRSDRVSQTRGVTHFAPIVDPVGMHDDIQFAKLVQQKVVSCFAILREREIDWKPGGDDQRGARTNETLADGSTRVLEGIAPGMDVAGSPGEKLLGFSPNVPNPEFFPHATLILTFIAINLDLPVAVLLLDPSRTNFSGWRGAMDQARMRFQDIQRWEVDTFHRPVYRFKVRQWLAADDQLRALGERDGVKILGHRWIPPTWPYIEPLKDASADLLRVRNALISHRRRAAERQLDWDDLSTEICEDNALLIRKAYEKAQALNQEFPELHVTWREVASLPTPDGVKVTVDAGGTAEDENARRN